MLTVERSAIGKAYLAWGGEPLLAYGPGDEIPSSVVRRTYTSGQMATRERHGPEIRFRQPIFPFDPHRPMHDYD